MRLLPAPARPVEGPRRRAAMLRLVTAALTVVLLFATGYAAGASRPAQVEPEVGSVDVGFARDMTIHHGQAVTLAMIIIPRATVPAVREMAGEIATSQQYEAGLMTGWLQQWGQPASTATPAMSWMAHSPAPTTATDPPMPGMATRRDVARLAVIRGRSADLLFCRLMRLHHLGGLHMIDEVIERGSRPEVIALAIQMRTTQHREINELNRIVAHLTTMSEHG